LGVSTSHARAARPIYSAGAPQRRSQNGSERRDCEVITCAGEMNADRAIGFPLNATTFSPDDIKTGIGCRSYLL
jgi:hypothetical protein